MLDFPIHLLTPLLHIVCRFAISAILVRLKQESLGALLLPPCDALESGIEAVGSAPQVVGQPIFPVSYQTWNVTQLNLVVNVTCNNAGK